MSVSTEQLITMGLCRRFQLDIMKGKNDVYLVMSYKEY